MGVDIASLLSLQARSRRNARSQLLVLRRRLADADQAALIAYPMEADTNGTGRQTAAR